MKDSRIYLLSWDRDGLDSVVDLTELEQQQVWQILSSPTADPHSHHEYHLQHMLLRAKCNPQRLYEIYTVHMEPHITEQDVRDLFHNDATDMIALIRENGNQLYRETTG